MKTIVSPSSHWFSSFVDCHIYCGLWIWSVSLSNIIFRSVVPKPPSSVVLSFLTSHGTLIVIVYHRQKAGDVIEYTSHPSIVFTSTFCSNQLHTFLWYISCLSSYGKLLVLINRWPKGCYVIWVTGEWMYQGQTIGKKWILIDELTAPHWTKQMFLPTSSC